MNEERITTHTLAPAATGTGQAGTPACPVARCRACGRLFRCTDVADEQEYLPEPESLDDEFDEDEPLEWGIDE